ncbi:T7SS effector LXG polymorphic toxin, partial [Bacillus altitudinis]|uniref:T7SS effector LXG polymorphic toxin n=1 Tax=Bacillus altitudinis TaxID=293387 RepID=UPI001C92BB21
FTPKGPDNIKTFYKHLPPNLHIFITFIHNQKPFHQPLSPTLHHTNFPSHTFLQQHFLHNPLHIPINNPKTIVNHQKNPLKTIFQHIHHLISLDLFHTKTFHQNI